MKFRIHKYNNTQNFSSEVEGITTEFESLMIPTHDKWKRGKKNVIQQVLVQMLTNRANEIGLNDGSLNQTDKLSKRVKTGINSLFARFGKDAKGRRFVVIPCFIHSSGAERILVFTKMLFLREIVDYIILWAPSDSLASITDGIVKESIFRECLSEYRGEFPQPVFVIEILEQDFFNLKQYRADKQFWKDAIKNEQTFSDFLKNEPGVRRHLGF